MGCADTYSKYLYQHKYGIYIDISKLPIKHAKFYQISPKLMYIFNVHIAYV